MNTLLHFKNRLRVLMFVCVGVFGFASDAFAFDIPNNTTYYFDNSQTSWSTPHIFIGTASYLRSYVMTSVGNDIWSFTVTPQWTGATAFYFGNGSGGATVLAGSSSYNVSTAAGSLPTPITGKTNNVTSLPSNFYFIPYSSSGTSIAGEWKANLNVPSAVLSGTDIMFYINQSYAGTLGVTNNSSTTCIATTAKTAMSTTDVYLSMLGTNVPGTLSVSNNCGGWAGTGGFTSQTATNAAGARYVTGGSNSKTNATTFTSVTPSSSSIPFGTASVNLTAVTSSATTSYGRNMYIQYYVDGATTPTLTSAKATTSTVTAYNTSALSEGVHTIIPVMTDRLVFLKGTSFTITVTGSSPIITLGTSSGTYNVAVNGTSGVQTSSVTGSNLTANIVATAPTYYEVSSDGSTWGSTATFVQSGGNVSGTLSIRYKPTASENAVAKNITLASTGATTVNYVATGTAPAVISATPTTATYSTTVGGTSASQSFTVTGSYLTANITATAPAYYQVSTDNSSWSATGGNVTFTPSSGSVNATLYVRYVPTGAETSANKTVALTSTNSNTQNITVTGTAVQPLITLGTSSGTYSANVGATSGVQTATVTGSNLNGNITATAPAYYEVSSDGTTWGSTATFVQSGGSVSGTLSIRYKPTAGENAVGKTISLASSGATTVNYTATGTAANSITVQFQQPADWSGSGYLYAFNGGTLTPSGIGSGWPGLIMTNAGGGWWTYTFTYTNSDVTIVFNNGNGNGKQTVNITGVNSDRCYTLTGTGTNYGVTLATCPSVGPAIGVTPATAAFSTTVGGTSASQTFAVTGTNLTADIVVTAPAYYQVSKDNSSWSTTGGSVSYTPSSGSVSANLYVRYVPTGSETAVAKSVSLASTGATTQNITVTGTTSTLKVSKAVTGPWTDGNSWVGNVAPTTSDIVQIVSGAVITISSNFTQTGAITVDAGGQLIATSKFVTNAAVAINGTFTIGGSLNGGGGNATVTGSGTWTYGAASTLEFRSTGTYNFNSGNGELCWPATNSPFNVSLIAATTNNGGLQLNDNLARTINGTLLIQNTNNLYRNGSGGYTVNGTVQLNTNGVFGNNVVTYGPGSKLLFNTGTTVTSMSGPWVTGTGGPGLGLPASVQISNNTTLTIPNSSNYTVKGDLTIDSGSTVNTPSANTLTVSGNVLNSGTLTLGASTGGNITVGGNWTNSGTFTHNNRTVTFNGSGTQTITKSGGESFGDLTVAKTASSLLQPANDINIAGNFTVTSGNVQNASGVAKTITMTGATPTLSVGESITGTNVGAGNDINLTYSNTTGTLTVSGAGSVCRFLNVSLPNTGATLTLTRGLEVMFGTFTVNGTLKLNAGGFVSAATNAVAPTYGSSSLLLYNSGATYNRSIEWSANSGAGYPNDITLSNSTTLDYPNNAGDNTTNLSLARDLTIGAGSKFYMDFGLGMSSGAVTVGRDISIAGDLSLGDGTGGDIHIKGNWTHTTGLFTPNGRAVFFNAETGDQTIVKSGGETFDYMIVDKATSGNVVLSNNATFNNTLSLTKGLLVTGTNKAIIPSTGSVTRTNGWINGNLQKNITTSGTKVFEVGDDTNYAPASLNVSATDFAAGDVLVSTSAISDFSNSPYSTLNLDTTKAIARAWSVTKPSGSTFASTYTGTFTYVAGDLLGTPTVSTLRTAVYNGSSWSYPGTVTTGTNQVIAPDGISPSLTSTLVFASPITPTISVSGTQNFTYNSFPQGPASITTASDGDRSLLYTNVGGTAYSSSTAPTNAGNYQVVASVTESNNYSANSSSPYLFTIDKRALTITVNDQVKCQGSVFSFDGSEYTRGSIVAGDSVDSITLTSAGSSSGAAANSYAIVGSNAVGTGIANYDITYVDGTLLVNPLPTGSVSGTTTTCLSTSSPLITFTGASGTGIVKYKFYYTIDSNPTELSVISATGSSTATVSVPTNTVRTAVYTLVRVEDFNTGCSQAQSGTASVTIGLCTTVMPNQCGSTIATLDTPIYCNGITGATDYRFKVTKNGVDYFYDNDILNIRAFKLTQIPGVAEYSKSYSVSVSLFYGGQWLAYGTPCTINTPALVVVNTTQIMLNRCGTTLPTLNTTIYANSVVGATQYRFEVTGGSFGVRTFDSPYRYFTLSQLSPGGGESSTTYSIRVAINNGTWQSYGPACNVSTPAPITRMAAQDINSNVFEVKAFPNPFARHFSLDIQSSSDDLVQVQVYDMLGRELEVQKATVSELSTKEIGTNYPSGVYNVIVSQGDKVRSVRMIKR